MQKSARSFREESELDIALSNAISSKPKKHPMHIKYESVSSSQ